jgi:hypothetical protein
MVNAMLWSTPKSMPYCCADAACNLIARAALQPYTSVLRVPSSSIPFAITMETYLFRPYRSLVQLPAHLPAPIRSLVTPSDHNPHRDSAPSPHRDSEARLALSKRGGIGRRSRETHAADAAYAAHAPSQEQP